MLAIPWALKPLYGLISDLRPLAGSRRRGYLIAAGAMARSGFLAAPASPGFGLLAWLSAATLAVAFADVAADALMIEVGGPLGPDRPLAGIAARVPLGRLDPGRARWAAS